MSRRIIRFGRRRRFLFAPSGFGVSFFFAFFRFPEAGADHVLIICATAKGRTLRRDRKSTSKTRKTNSPPEIFDRVKAVDRSQRLSPRRRGHLARAGAAGLLVVEPERPLVLERVGGWGVVGHFDVFFFSFRRREKKVGK